MSSSVTPRDGLPRTHTPVRASIVDASELVVAGLRSMLAPFSARVEVRVGLADDAAPPHVLLVDPVAGSGFVDVARMRLLAAAGTRVVAYTWRPLGEVSAAAWALQPRGPLDGWLATSLPAASLVDALERVTRGEVVIEPVQPPGRGPDRGRPESLALTPRERDMLLLIARGLRNDEIARMEYLSINTVKSYVRNAYAKTGVSTRVGAVIWAHEHRSELSLAGAGRGRDPVHLAAHSPSR